MNRVLEAPMRDLILEIMSQWFHVEKEVWGTHWSGKRLRMDAMLRPFDRWEWGDGEDTAFGLEFKQPQRRSFKDATKLLAQAHDYVETNWDGYGYRKVAVYPPFTSVDKGSPSVAWHGAVSRIAGQFGVGELKFQHQIITLEFSAQFVWRAGYDPATGRALQGPVELHQAKASLVPKWGAK